MKHDWRIHSESHPWMKVCTKCEILVDTRDSEEEVFVSKDYGTSLVNPNCDKEMIRVTLNE